MEAPKICAGCSKPIEEGDFLEIDQGAFHAECFVCDGCKRNLAGESFIPVENKVCCEACYYDKHAPKCKGCTKPIKTTTFLKIGEDSFHRDCFVCVKCKALFKTMTYFKSPDGMLCESCFKGSLKTCAGCKEPIKEKLYSAFDKYWHDKCFRCGVCYKSFDNLSFVPFKGKGYHLECYQKNMIKTCKVCNKICNEDYFEAKNGDAVHEGACLDKYKADSDKLKSAADAIHAKWADRLKAEANEFTFVPKGEENVLGEPRASIGGDQKTYPYEQLIKAPFPPGVDMTKRETYLTEEEFEKRLGMTKEAFYEKKKWRQDEIKKKVSLF